MMTRTEILGLLTELLLEEVSLQDLNTGHEAIEAYRGLVDQTEAEDSDLDEIIPDVIDAFIQKRTKLEEEKKKKQRLQNLKEKEAVIEDLRLLIQDEENIGKAFNTFHEVRDRFNEIGDVPRDQYGRIQAEFSRLQESFYYNISIYKELADHDKKVNLRKKKELIEKVKELKDEKSIQEADKKLKTYIKNWDDVGATFQNDWEEVKDQFWTEARSVIARVNSHYEGIRARQTEFLEKKKQLIRQVLDIAEKPRSKRKEWNDAVEKVLSIQKDWKKIGFSSDNESVWKEFRAACDTFFEAKQGYFDQLGQIYDERKKKKLSIIEKAAALSTSTDWKNTADSLIRLQNEWKEVGSTSQKDENRLWKDFRSHCDSFFNARNKNFKAREKDEKENLKVKEDLIQRVKNFSLSGKRSADIDQLKAFSKEWSEIGHVPFKQKDKIHKGYSAAIGVHYDAIKLNDNEKRQVMMQQKLDSVKNDPRSANKEKAHIRRQIDHLMNENRQYDNNLGFFNDPSGNNPMVKEVERKIKRNQNRIKELKEMLRMLDSVS